MIELCKENAAVTHQTQAHCLFSRNRPTNQAFQAQKAAGSTSRRPVQTPSTTPLEEGDQVNFTSVSQSRKRGS